MTAQPSRRGRGRPPHPDILTPREWQVLDLLRQGLTNEQIAQRLDISFATAKYHVAEIISKLGVATREEAAAWQAEAAPKRPWWTRAAAPLTEALGRFAPLTLAKAALAAGALAVLVGVAILALVFWRNSNDEKGEATSSGDSQYSLSGGFTITGAVSTRISWADKLPPNCYQFSDEAGTPAFFFGVVSPKDYQVYASIQPFMGPGSYNAAAPPARGPGQFDWGNSALHVFKPGNDQRERWTATAGDFVLDRQYDGGAEGSLEADLQPAGPDAIGPIHITGSWICRHSGN